MSTPAFDLTPLASRLVYLWDRIDEAKGPKAKQIANAGFDGAGEAVAALGLAPTAFAVRLAMMEAVEAIGPRQTYGPKAKEQRTALVADLTKRLEVL